MNQLTRSGARVALRTWTAVLAAAALLVSGPAHAQQGSAGLSVERGRYLVQITGCHDCHSPKIEGMTPDLTRALSGRPGTTAPGQAGRRRGEPDQERSSRT